MKKLLLAFAVATLGIASAIAQDFPARPITIVAPFPPGGATDKRRASSPTT